MTLGSPNMLETMQARMLAHQQNLERFRSLLTTSLTEQERQYIHQRIAEEQFALDNLKRELASGALR